MKLKDILTSPFRFLKERYFSQYPTGYEDMEKNSGRIVEEDGKKIAIFKDKEGNIHKLSAYCTHLGCVVHWNDKEKQWDCPCHGSTFAKEGTVKSGPAKKELKTLEKAQNQEYIVVIEDIKQITHDVKRFRTTKPRNYTYTPGQATEVAINKEGFKDKFRPFTFTSLNEDNFLEYTIKGYSTDKYPDHTGVTEKIHKLQVGDEFLIKPPVGTIKYQGKGIYIAGGAGITPFIAIFRFLDKKNNLEGNTLIFSNKQRRDVIIEEELREKFNNDNLVLTLTKDKERGYEYGRIDKEILKKYVDNFNQYFYICGPSGFENDITETLSELGVKRDNIVVEEW